MNGWTRIHTDAGDLDCFTPVSRAPQPFALIHLRDRDGTPPPDDPTLTQELERHGLRALSPIATDHWWLDRNLPGFNSDLTPLAWLSQTLLPEFATRWNVAVPQIGLIGTGVGGHGVLQLAYRWPRKFPVVAAMAPAVDFHTQYDADPLLQEVFPNAEAARQETATLRMHPMNWPQHQWFACDPRDPDWFDGCERLASKLGSIGIPFESDLTTSIGGRRSDYERHMLPRAVAFVLERLQRISGAVT
jgi:hypothetical protein